MLLRGPPKTLKKDVSVGKDSGERLEPIAHSGVGDTGSAVWVLLFVFTTVPKRQW